MSYNKKRLKKLEAKLGSSIDGGSESQSEYIYPTIANLNIIIRFLLQLSIISVTALILIYISGGM